MQKELYTQQLQGARDQWKAMNDAQQAEVAARNGYTKSGYESQLREREKNLELGRMWDPQAGRYVQIPGAAEAAGAQAGAVAGAQQEAKRQAELDTPKEYNFVDPVTRAPRTVTATPRDVMAGKVPGLQPGYETGLGEPEKARIELHKTAAVDARQIASTGQRLAPILDEIIRIADKTPQGMAGPIGAALAARVSALGFPVSESLTNAELMRSLSQQLIPTVRQPGAQSNAEMAVYSLAVPGLQQSAIGRLQIAHLNRAMIDRANEIANLREDNIGAADLNQKLTALHNKPLFTDEQRAIMHAGTGRRVTDDATFDALPIGMPFVNAKGEHTIKKANRTPAQ
jgi:hypothetical protein